MPKSKVTHALARRPAPNAVFYDLRSYHSPWDRLAVLSEPHDGTRLGMKRAAEFLQQRAAAEFGHGVYTHAGSVLYVTDQRGELLLTISPNLLVFEPVDRRARLTL